MCFASREHAHQRNTPSIVKWAAAAIPIVSAIGLTLGLLFDVAFLWAVDRSFITLFSLSEHFLFALFGLPAAVLIVLAIYIFGMVMYLVERYVISLDDVTSPHHVAQIAAKSTMGLRIWLFAGGSVLFCIVVLVSAVRSAEYMTWLFSGATLAMGAIATSLIRPKSFGQRLTAFLLPFPLTFTVGAGYIAGQKVISDPPLHTITTEKGEMLEGRVVRSGGAGVLYIDDKKQPTFRRWEYVSTITLKAKGSVPKRESVPTASQETSSVTKAKKTGEQE